jgi:hypothetical protein
VTIAHRDVPVRPEMPSLFAMRLVLFVPWPTGKASRVNQYRHGEDRQLSAVRLSVVSKEDVAAGECVVHITAHLPGFKQLRSSLPWGATTGLISGLRPRTNARRGDA